MYSYPLPCNDNYFSPIAVTPTEHTMGDSLYRYLSLKVHPLIRNSGLEEIIIIGRFDRSSGLSNIEKTGKMFNYMRPTAQLSNDGKTLSLFCFPGIDYVYHFSNIIKTYSILNKRKLTIKCIFPSELECWTALDNSGLRHIPVANTVIMGYVEGLDFLSSDITWQRSGNFFYKTFKTKSGTALLLGCTHTFWGEIAGRIVAYLAEMGVKRIIYSGKLGTLNPDLIPNQSLATGNLSILPNGQVVIWKNLFENIHHKKIYHGVHITMPSVLQENINWALTQKETISFVDPEIGHMAYAAQTSGVEYSYLHIISDNLCRKYQYDLSNERENNVIAHRQILLKIIGQAIIEL